MKEKKYFYRLNNKASKYDQTQVSFDQLLIIVQKWA